jgi:ribosomal protein L24E
MQGYWNGRIGIGEKFAASARHPPIMGARSSRSLVFEAVYQGAGDIVVAGDGTSPVISRRTGDRFYRQQTGPRVKSKWNTQSHAIRRLDKRESRPARRAKPFTFADWLTAGGTELREGKIERDLKDCLHAFAKASGV